MLLPASFSARILLGTKISVGTFSERFHTETSFQGIFPVGKLLCKSMVERQTSCAKTCAWFLQNQSDSSRQKFSHETKFASRDKTKNIHIPKWNHAPSGFSLCHEMRHAKGLIGKHVAAMRHRPIDRKASPRLRRKTSTGQILSNLPVQIKNTKRWYQLTGIWLNLFPSKLENMSVPDRSEKKAFLWKLVKPPCYFSIIDIYSTSLQMFTHNAPTRAYTHTHTHTHILYIYIYIYIYVYICIYICMHTDMHAWRTHTYTHTDMHTYVNAYIHTKIHFWHTYKNSRTHTYPKAQHTHINTQTHSTHTRQNIHTSTHKHIQHTRGKTYTHYTHKRIQHIPIERNGCLS